MGFALAKEAYLNGADVTLISGNSNEDVVYNGIELIKVDTAEEMFLACKDRFPSTDIVMMNAAVADYKPTTVSEKKIKKTDENMTIELTKTIDILKYIGDHKKDTQFVMGFALETNDEEKNAFKKLRNKHIDCIVLNSLKVNGAGFKSDTNAVTIINKDETLIQFALQSKTDIARHIISYIIKHTNEK